MESYTRRSIDRANLSRLTALTLFLRQRKTHSPTTILVLRSVEIHIGDGNLIRSLLVDNPKCLSDDCVVLNLYAMAVTKHKQSRNARPIRRGLGLGRRRK